MIEESFKIRDKDLCEKIGMSTESGMGYHVIKVTTKDGRHFENVLVINGNEISGIYGYKEFPFSEDEIINVEVTNLRRSKDFDQAKWLYLKRGK